MIKVVINNCHGGFGLSTTAMLKLIEMGSELVAEEPLTRYTGKETTEQAVAYMFDSTDNAPTPIGYNLVADYYGNVIDPIKGIMYHMDYPMSRSENESDEDWYRRTDMKRIYFRTHPDLVGVVEELGEKASGRWGRLVIREVPDEDVTVDMLDIGEYDGSEWVEERHRTW